MMTHRERLETAWRFTEPDRVPIELCLAPDALKHPAAARLVTLAAEHADNFLGVPGAAWGFLGLPAHSQEEVIEEQPGAYRRVRRVHETAVGSFTAITYHPAGSPASDFHWEKRFVSTLEDMARLADAPRAPATWDCAAHRARVAAIGGQGIPVADLLHPLGALVRNATMEEMYAWFREEPGLVHRFLAAANDQVAATVARMQTELGAGITFMSWAHEMLIPPWMGRELFAEFVRPYDQKIYAAVHRGGGRFRAHCHGNCMEFLETMADMGVDAIEPLEHAPTGNVVLAEAKRRVGDRMLLSGNIASEQFVRLAPTEVRARVCSAIRDAAPGGGFTLRTSGGYANTGGVTMTEAELRRVFANCEAYLLAGLELGPYPIRL